MSDLIFAERRQDLHTSGTCIALIVDDDPGIHAITRTVLRDLIYENRTAGEGASSEGNHRL
jgi:hypothetical protein